MFSDCQDINVDKIEEDLDKDKQSKRDYILQLRSDESWVVGYIQENTDKLLAEQSAIASLSQLLETRVKEEFEQTIKEVETDQGSTYGEWVKASLTFISDVTIRNPQLFHIKKDDIWRVISLKCKEEYTQEQKLFNDRIFEKVTYYWEQYLNSSNNRFDIANSVTNMIQAHLLMSAMTSINKTNYEMSEAISNELNLFLNNIYLKGPDSSIKVAPYTSTNKNIELNCEYQSEDGETFPVNDFDLKAEYIQGSVENFDDWSNNAKSVYVSNGSLIFQPGYINSKSQNLKIIFYPDIEEIVNRLIIRLEAETDPITISSDIIKKIIAYFKEKKRIIYMLELKNTMKIQTYISLEETLSGAVSVRALPENEQRYVQDNTMFNIVNDEKIANMKIILLHDFRSDKADLVLLKKDQFDEYEEITKIKNISFNLRGIVLGFQKLESSIFDTDLIFEKCADVSIVIENARFSSPKHIRDNTGTIKVRKGKVNYKVFYSKDISEAYFDTTFYVHTTKDLNDFHKDRKICFEKKSIFYPLTFNKYIIANQNSVLLWDNNKQEIDKGNAGTVVLEGYRHKEHTLIYKKNGLKPLKKIAPPTKESEYPIYIDPERIKLNFINNMKYTLVPGRSQIELYSASELKKIQGYIYQTGFLFLLGKTIYHYSKYDAKLTNYYNCKDNYVNADANQDLDLLYSQCTDYHELIDPEIGNVKLFGQSLALLFIANLVEVTVDNFLF